MLQSPPSWRRGLKSPLTPSYLTAPGRLLRGGVDWNVSILLVNVSVDGRLLRGGVDWNNSDTATLGTPASRLLRGGVDWNHSFSFSFDLWTSRLLRGGVDWNKTFYLSMIIVILSPPSWRRGLKYYKHDIWTCVHVASFVEAWIEIVLTAISVTM